MRIFSFEPKHVFSRPFGLAFLLLLIPLMSFDSVRAQAVSKSDSPPISVKAPNSILENFTITDAAGNVLMQLENAGGLNGSEAAGGATLLVDGTIELGALANEEKLRILDLGNGEDVTIGATETGMKLRIPVTATENNAPRSVVIEGDDGISATADIEIAKFNNDGTFQLGTENQILGTTDGVTISLPPLLGSNNAPRSVVIEGDDGLSSTTQPYFVVENSGKVGIGKSNPTNILTVVKNSNTDPIADAWTTYSSRRWKTNIHTIEGALDKVQNLRGVTYDWKSDGKHDIGLIAEEVGAVIPEVVVFEENGIDAQSVDYPRLVAVLIEALKEQQQMIGQLTDKITSSKAALLQTQTILQEVETKLAGVEELTTKMTRLEAALLRLEQDKGTGIHLSSHQTRSN